MRKQHGKLAAGLAAVLMAALLVTPVQADDHHAKKSVSDIRQCMAGNLVQRGALRDLSARVTDREGKARLLKLKLFWKPTKAGAARLNLRVLEPAELYGSSYLMLEGKDSEEMYFYLPASGQPQKVTGQMTSQPLWGTDFSYGEIKQVHGVLESGPTTRKADAKLGERTAYVLEAETAPEKTGYQKVVSYVDQQSCVLLKSEFIGKNGKLAKVLEGDTSTLFQVDQYWVMLNYGMKDLRKNTNTQLAMSELNLLEGSPEAMFDPKTFYQNNKQ